jgi:hypothetical protein
MYIHTMITTERLRVPDRSTQTQKPLQLTSVNVEEAKNVRVYSAVLCYVLF